MQPVCGVGVRVERQPLIDVNADAVDARRAGRLEDAVTGVTGHLEHDIRARELCQELLGERRCPAPGLWNASFEKSLTTYLLLTLTSG